MVETVFRTKVEPTPEVEATPAPKSGNSTVSTSTVEVPYTSYAQEHAKPYSVDYFELGSMWDDSTGGFSKEVSTIEEYFTHKIESGEIENSIEAVKNKLKSIEKMSNLEKDGRKVIRLGVVSAYMKFLMDTDNIKFNIRRYAHA